MHCGFSRGASGFDISAEDRSFLNKCQVAVGTCLFGGADDLAQPIGQYESSLKRVRGEGLGGECTLWNDGGERGKGQETRLLGFFNWKFAGNEGLNSTLKVRFQSAIRPPVCPSRTRTGVAHLSVC